MFQPDALPEPVARTPLSSTEKNSLLRYGVDEPLLFVGHYWRSGKPAPIRHNLACLDYSAVLYGKLVAYRLDQETRTRSAQVRTGSMLSGRRLSDEYRGCICACP